MKSFLQDRDIRLLIHFTNVNNLPSILEFGLLPIDELRRRKINTFVNDNLRTDFCTSATSLSIEFPNYKMFYKVRREHENDEWVIICLKVSVLYEKECAYCYDNASNEIISSTRIEERKTIEAFKYMFSDIPGYPTRNERGLRNYYTTLPQAEVLVFDIIEPKYFESVIFRDSISLKKYKNILHKNIRYEIIPEYFSAREDYKYWI